MKKDSASGSYLLNSAGIALFSN